MTDIPKLDFLFSKITDVHFGAFAYVVITVEASDHASGFAPSPPTAGVSGENFLAASKPVTEQVLSKPMPSTQDFYFIWAGGAPFPTPDTVGAAISLPNGPIPYGGQFSLYNDFGSGFAQVFPPGASTEGFYGSLASAESAAVVRNSEVFSSSPGPYIIEWFNIDPGVPDGEGDFGGFEAGHVAITTVSIPQGTSTLKQQFLLGPLPIGGYAYSVTFGGSTKLTAGVDAKLIFCPPDKVTSFADFPGGITVAEGQGGGKGFRVSVAVTVGQDESGSDSSVVVEFSDGGGGPQ